MGNAEGGRSDNRARTREKANHLQPMCPSLVDHVFSISAMGDAIFERESNEVDRDYG